MSFTSFLFKPKKKCPTTTFSSYRPNTWTVNDGESKTNVHINQQNAESNVNQQNGDISDNDFLDFNDNNFLDIFLQTPEPQPLQQSQPQAQQDNYVVIREDNFIVTIGTQLGINIPPSNTFVSYHNALLHTKAEIIIANEHNTCIIIPEYDHINNNIKYAKYVTCVQYLDADLSPKYNCSCKADVCDHEIIANLINSGNPTGLQIRTFNQCNKQIIQEDNISGTVLVVNVPQWGRREVIYSVSPDRRRHGLVWINKNFSSIVCDAGNHASDRTCPHRALVIKV